MNARPEYLAAYEAHNVALAVYHEVVTAYRSKLIGDAELAAAQADKKAADAAFDAAFLAEQDRSDAVDSALVADDAQLALI
jgi:hypothetical protein